MFNSDKQRERASAKQKVRDRINAGFDRSKYKYIPEEKPLNYTSFDKVKRFHSPLVYFQVLSKLPC